MARSVPTGKIVQVKETVDITPEMTAAGKQVLGHMICEGCPYDILAEMVYEAMRPLEPAPKAKP